MPIADRVSSSLFLVRTLSRAGLLALSRPDRLAAALVALRRFGLTPAAGYAAAARRFPDDVAIVDESGTVSYREVDERSNALANALADDGVAEGDGVGIMVRNHRGWVEAVVACSKLGADALLLNTSFSGPQLTDVCRRERVTALIYDEEFAEVLGGAGRRRKRYVAWHEPDTRRHARTLDELVSQGDRSAPPAPSRQGKAIILTSGTTGTPKGASRTMPKSLDPVAALLDRIPLHARERTMIAAPLFHAWGFAHFLIGLGLNSTLVLKRRFDPEATLSLTAQHECTALVVVPVMLQRILGLDDEVLSRYDLGKLRVVPVSGSALSGAISERWMDLYGENLFNLYGSTEVAWATIATPQDLRAAPGTAGRVPRFTTVRLYDQDGSVIDGPDVTGAIYVANDVQMEGYTGGGGKDSRDGLMSSGDVGHFDADGRLFIDGRDDDMIVSGGENVFPGEVEDLLGEHPGVEEAAVFGVEDERFGQRLNAVVVRARGADPSEDELKAHVKANLAGYKVPREITFIAQLPRTSTGKVLKRELREAADS